LSSGLFCTAFSSSAINALGRVISFQTHRHAQRKISSGGVYGNRPNDLAEGAIAR
jgi:hypothetical protein